MSTSTQFSLASQTASPTLFGTRQTGPPFISSAHPAAFPPFVPQARQQPNSPEPKRAKRSHEEEERGEEEREEEERETVAEPDYATDEKNAVARPYDNANFEFNESNVFISDCGEFLSVRLRGFGPARNACVAAMKSLFASYKEKERLVEGNSPFFVSRAERSVPRNDKELQLVLAIKYLTKLQEGVRSM